MTSETIAATVHRAWAADMSATTLYQLLKLRVDVFVVEQDCAYGELDGRDLEDRARHYWLSSNEKSPEILGCLRLLKEPGGEYRIGRLCTAKSARGRGLGRQLLEAGLAEVGDKECLLWAQEYLLGFYRGYGFEPDGPVELWDGVPQVPVRRTRRENPGHG